MTEKANKPQKSRTYLVLIAISFAYIGVYYLLMRETQECKSATDVFIRDHWFHGFWDRYLACRSINELGDALAGAFAPVAFMWLAGTVFIQSQELLAQRQELDETQEVMREQLNVARLQVEETKASTLLFKEQTQILKEQQIQREMEIADAEFDSAIAAFQQVVNQRSGLRTVQAIEFFQSSAPTQDMGYLNASPVNTPPFPARDGFVWLTRVNTRHFITTSFAPPLSVMCGEIRRATSGLLNDWPLTSEIEVHLPLPQNSKGLIEDLEVMVAELNQLKKIGERISHAKKHEMRTSYVDETRKALLMALQWVNDGESLRAQLAAKSKKNDQAGEPVNPPPGTTPV
ncbi:hypothetical protein [Agrobacterium fabrum]|uniref:hypothetical protein n=1 Tax=Agrobacterium fabrum TaxID=1176649 RepID=UPI003B9F9215